MVGQIAVWVIVLVCAGLLARSAAYAAHMNFGFRTDHIVMLSTSLRGQTYDTVRGHELQRDLLRFAARVPGVRSVVLRRYLPFGFDRDIATVFPLASPVRVPASGFSYFTNLVGGDYFEVMGIRVLGGRAFTDRDDRNTPNVAVVNDAFAKATWPGETAVGKRFRVGGPDGPILEIVGVVAGTQDLFSGETPKPYIFRPATWPLPIPVDGSSAGFRSCCQDFVELTDIKAV